MAAPHVHAHSCVRKWGGVIEDYLAIEEKMDCSKGYFPSNIHRVLTHHMFWVMEVMVPIFGNYITNSDGRMVSVKDICERHILEDFRMRFIPSAQDYLEHVEFADWMNNGVKGCPSSCKKVLEKKNVVETY